MTIRKVDLVQDTTSVDVRYETVATAVLGDSRLRAEFVVDR
jgi:hypothetical protein